MRHNMLMGALALTALFLAGVGIAADPTAPPVPMDKGVMTMAVEYGLTKSQIVSFDPALSARLVRFGKVAMGRGRYLEAKRLFWQALLVDPTSKLAWLYYDQSVVMGIGHQLERYPNLLGLDGLTDEPGQARPAKADVREGC